MSERRLRLLVEQEKRGDALVKTQRELGDLDKAAKQGQGGAAGLGSALAKIGVGISIAAVTKQVYDFGKASIAAASNVEEMTSKFNIVFGDLAGQFEKNISEFAQSVGRSRFELMGFGAAVQDTFVPMGFARDQAAEMSETVVKLAVDLSSFNNMPMGEALDRLQGTLVGAHRNALSFGVIINENVLSQELMRIGADKLTGSQLEAAKVQARLNLLIAGTTDAQGDAARTSDSYANKQRALQASVEELQVAIGEKLLPQMTELTGSMIELVEWTTANLDAIEKWTGGFMRVQQAISTAGFTELIQTIKKQSDGATIAAASMDELAVRVSEAGGNYVDFAKQAREAGMIIGHNAPVVFNAAIAKHTLAQATLEAEQADRKFLFATEATGNAIEDTSDAIEIATHAVMTYAERMRYMEQVSKDAAQAGDEYAHSSEFLTERERLKKEALKESEDALREQERALKEAEEAQKRFNAQTGQYFNAAITAKDGQTDFNQSLYDSALAAGASAEQLAILGGALGLYSEEAVEAALKSAAVQVKINELAQAYVNGEIGVEGMRRALANFIAELDRVPDEKTVNVKTTYSSSGSPGPGGGEARASGGPVRAGGTYQVGEGGAPELYRGSDGGLYMIPGDNGQVFSNASSQAMMSGSGSTSTTWTGDINVSGVSDPNAAAELVVRKLQDRGLVPRVLLR